MDRADDAPTAYARNVLDGKIPSGQLVHLSCERHLRDLQAGSTRGLAWDHRAAERAIQFFRFLRHSKGEWAGQPFVLAGWKRADGTRQYRTAYVEIPRKNGKSRSPLHEKQTSVLNTVAVHGLTRRLAGALTRGQLHLGLPAALLILIAIAVMSYATITGTLRAFEERRRTFLIIGHLERLLSEIMGAETGQRGYLITGPPPSRLADVPARCPPS